MRRNFTHQNGVVKWRKKGSGGGRRGGKEMVGTGVNPKIRKAEKNLGGGVSKIKRGFEYRVGEK